MDFKTNEANGDALQEQPDVTWYLNKILASHHPK